MNAPPLAAFFATTQPSRAHRRWLTTVGPLIGLLLLPLLFAAGCEQPGVTATQASAQQSAGAAPPPPAPVVNAPATPSFPDQVDEPDVEPELFDFVESTLPSEPERPRPSPTLTRGATSPSVSSGQGRDLPVMLRRGVALPQTLPTGTQVSFSVEYEFVQGAPSSSYAYIWVIESGRGKPIAVPCRPTQRQGTLTLLASGLRPEAKPFRCYLMETRAGGERRRISKTTPLR